MNYLSTTLDKSDFKSDENGKYLICPECGEKLYIDECETDKWWDEEGNHRMLYICNCGQHLYE